MISARIPEKLSHEIEALAESTRRSKAFLITEALEDYVKRQTWLVKRIDHAIRDADESGEYVSEEDMSVWLKSWGKPDKMPAPRLRKRDELP
jgi:predicted transcriptional regulator